MPTQGRLKNNNTQKMEDKMNKRIDPTTLWSLIWFLLVLIFLKIDAIAPQLNLTGATSSTRLAVCAGAVIGWIIGQLVLWSKSAAKDRLILFSGAVATIWLALRFGPEIPLILETLQMPPDLRPIDNGFIILTIKMALGAFLPVANALRINNNMSVGSMVAGGGAPVATAVVTGVDNNANGVPDALEGGDESAPAATGGGFGGILSLLAIIAIGAALFYGLPKMGYELPSISMPSIFQSSVTADVSVQGNNLLIQPKDESVKISEVRFLELAPQGQEKQPQNWPAGWKPSTSVPSSGDIVLMEYTSTKAPLETGFPLPPGYRLIYSTNGKQGSWIAIKTQDDKILLAKKIKKTDTEFAAP